MNEKDKTFLMLEYLFGENAGAARQGASERMLRWCEAFEAWMAEQERDRHPNMYRSARRVWRESSEFLEEHGWEVRNDKG